MNSQKGEGEGAGGGEGEGEGEWVTQWASKWHMQDKIKLQAARNIGHLLVQVLSKALPWKPGAHHSQLKPVVLCKHFRHSPEVVSQFPVTSKSMLSLHKHFWHLPFGSWGKAEKKKRSKLNIKQRFIGLLLNFYPENKFQNKFGDPFNFLPRMNFGTYRRLEFGRFTGRMVPK